MRFSLLGIFFALLSFQIAFATPTDTIIAPDQLEPTIAASNGMASSSEISRYYFDKDNIANGKNANIGVKLEVFREEDKDKSKFEILVLTQDTDDYAVQVGDIAKNGISSKSLPLQAGSYIATTGGEWKVVVGSGGKILSTEIFIDKRINDAIGPTLDYIANKFVFFPITFKKPIKASAEGYVSKITQADAGAGKVVITDIVTGSETIVSIPRKRKIEVALNQFVNTGTNADVLASPIAPPFVLIWLIVAALFFTIYFKFANVRLFGTAINIVRGKYTDPNEKGEVSHFQALATALSGTVGLGNIAGVAIAIATGGPGATFWMILAGLLGMSSKFAECTLGVKYRQVAKDGTVFGGPMYYLSQGLKDKGLAKLGKVMAIFFAIMCVGGSFGGGNMFQINQAVAQITNLPSISGSFVDDNKWILGLFVSGMVAIVLIGGIKSIAKVTDKIVPAMCGIYVLAALIILIANVGEIGHAFGLIISGAFSAKAAFGGLVGVLIQGFRRAAFSNEAGVGSASIAHSAVKTNHPASEGIVALLEPFIDTVVVCTMTALVIIITGYHINPDNLSGVDLTSKAFETLFPWFKFVLAVAVVLFAFSTMLSWSYYGLQSWKYIFGKSKMADISYKVLFCTFVVVGATMSLGKVTDFSDAMIFAMCFPNIVGLYILAPKVREELNKYLTKIRSGELSNKAKH